MRNVLIAALLVSAGAAQAGGPVVVADDPEIAAPAAAVAGFDWTGFYLGLHATQGSIDDGTVNADSSGYGVHGGYLRDFGRLVAGAELSYSTGSLEGTFSAFDVEATRLKLIGGYDAGRLMPYAFVGATRFKVSLGPNSNSDTLSNYGIGAKLALGETGNVRVGLEYLVEKTDRFGTSTAKLDGSELSLRLDYRF